MHNILLQVIEDNGIRWNDPRLHKMVEGLNNIHDGSNGLATVTDLEALERLQDISKQYLPTFFLHYVQCRPLYDVK